MTYDDFYEYIQNMSENFTNHGVSYILNAYNQEEDAILSVNVNGTVFLLDELKKIIQQLKNEDSELAMKFLKDEYNLIKNFDVP